VVFWISNATLRVNDGTNVAAPDYWQGTVHVGDTIIVTAGQSVADPGVTRTDYDQFIWNRNNNTVINGRESFWGETSSTFLTNINVDCLAGFQLQGGGAPPGSSHGTLYGVSLEQTFSSPTLGDSDRQLLVLIARSVVKPSYQVSVVHTNVCANTAIDLQPTTRAVGWTIDTRAPGHPVTSGLPPYYFGQGFVTPRVGPGYARSTRITFTPQLLELPEACHRVEFTITPGLCLIVTEYTIPLVIT